jgi:predicted small lipoprotein YifL
MFKRLLLIAAMTAALAACGTSGSTGTPGSSLAPVDSAAPVSAEPSAS